MATSYTSLLGLALPVQGELSGTWGDVVNNSITSLVDSAVAGTTTLSTDADVTLTTTTGAANTAREAILLCTGARTALRNITAPAQSKTYTVINATTGGFAVVIRGVGPTTGISVPAGFTAQVAWNGSDFVTGAVGAISATSITDSGNLTFTGTGNRITGDFSNATPASRVMFQTSTVNNQTLVAAIPNGTSVTSQFNVFNNSDATNASRGVMAISATDVNFQANITGTGTYLPMIFYTGGAERVRFDTSGNVGIGVTPSGGKLVVATSVTGTAFNTNNSTDTGFQVNFVSGLTSIGNNFNNPLAFITNGTEKVRIDASGNVGVGKTPVAGRGLLQVNGDVEMTSQNTGQLAGLRNVIINGGMQIAQRGLSASAVSVNSYLLDRFLFIAGTGTLNWSQQAGPSDNLPYSLNFGSTSAVSYYIGQRIEDARVLNAKTVTLSFWAKANSPVTLVNINLQQNFGSGGSLSVNTVFPSSNVTFTTAWQQFSLTVALPTTVGKTIGTSSFLELSLAFPATVTGIYITGVQLEIGSVATPFEQRPIGMELALCQRYFQRWTQPPLRGIAFSSILAGRMAMAIPTMRVVPTVTMSGNLPLQYGSTTTPATTTIFSLGSGYNTVSTIEFDANTPAVLVPGYSCLVYQSGTSYLDASAEL